MKNYLLLFIAFATSVAAKAQSGEPYQTTSLAGKSIQKVYARTSGGSITVAGSDSDQPKLEVYVKASNGVQNLSKEEIQQRISEDYEMTISTDNNLLSVVVKNKERNMNWKKQLNISFKIYVPKNVTNDLATSGGSISLSNLNGNQNFSTSGGSLNMDKLAGNIQGRTSGGSISVTNSSKTINLSTSGGSIKAENCEGTITLGTSGGSLNLTNLKGNIKATTSGGGVRASNIEGELVTHTSGGSINLTDINASVEASTSGGSTNVTLTDLGKYVKLHSSGGGITLNLPSQKGLNLDLSGDKVRSGTMTNFNGNTSERRINGTVNGGGIPVTVSGSGNVTINWR